MLSEGLDEGALPNESIMDRKNSHTVGYVYAVLMLGYILVMVEPGDSDISKALETWTKIRG